MLMEENHIRQDEDKTKHSLISRSVKILQSARRQYIESYHLFLDSNQNIHLKKNQVAKNSMYIHLFVSVQLAFCLAWT